MISLFLIVLKYLLVIILFLFIYRVLKLLKYDLERTAKENKNLKSSGIKKEQKSFVKLIILEGDGKSFATGQSIELRKKVSIGRGPDNNIVLTDQAVSKNHAKLWEEEGQWWIEDLGSKNGTIVNGSLISSPLSLVEGDKIKVGKFLFQFVRWNYEVQ